MIDVRVSNLTVSLDFVYGRIYKYGVSPTILREKGYRFFFFSREETRMHIHIVCTEGEAKYWLEPNIELSKNHNLSGGQLKEIENIIEAHYGEFKQAWEKHFRS